MVSIKFQLDHHMSAIIRKNNDVGEDNQMK